MAINYTADEISEILNEYFSGITHKQYIGARYVPIFGRKDEDTIEWDNTKPYEPLTIVLYEGNSFTSRQFVPIGVDIENQIYWAETGNYNAQVESYRQEVMAYKEDIDNYTLYGVPEKYGAYGDGIHDDTVALQNCIDENSTIVLNGKYKITNVIEISSPHAPNQEEKTVYNNGEIILDNTYIHIHGENVKFIGGLISGNGLISMMYLGQTPSIQTVSAIKCTVENVYFEATNNVAAITMLNYYTGIYGCYCNTVNNIYAYNTNCAINMIGDVNANNINDIIMWSNINNIVGMLVLEGIEYNSNTYGPKENNISKLFYYKGTNTPTILYKSNCGNGSYRNSFVNCTSEQGGTSSHFIEVEEGVSNGRNIYLGFTNNIYSGDFDRNTKERMIANHDTFIGSSNSFIGTNSLIVNSLSTNDALSIKNSFTNTFSKRQNENTAATLLTSGGRAPSGVDPMLHGGYIKIIVTEFYLNVSRLQHTEEILIHVNNNGTMSISEQIAENSRFSVDGTAIKYTTGDNGTSVSAYITCKYEVCCYDGNAEYAFTIPE